MNEKLSISLVFLTCNRKENIVAILDDLKRQTRQPDEILVVDNNSSDGTAGHIAAHYPEVRVIKLEENIACGGRNEGIRSAKGDVVVTLDDDIFFDQNDSLDTIERIFRQSENRMVVNFKVLDYQTRKMIDFNWFHPYQMETYADRSFRTDYISEGAVAFRRSLFDEVGYYPREFFISHEGPDLAYRILNAGYDMHYTPEVAVLHNCSMHQRTSWRNTYYDTRNQIWLAVRNLPLRLAIQHVVYRLITTLLFALRRRQVGWYLKAVLDGIRGIKSQLPNRDPIDAATIRRLKMIRKHKPNVIYHFFSFMRRTKAINKRFGR